ncbi:XdhC family protein [Veillonella sp.]|uniref:XdhC family protein n=1 Tax=Veillonella sp. TaxID=1926307 RepID=UPI0025D2A5DD|nr:XdhC family protein [Veillonella sp.]
MNLYDVIEQRLTEDKKSIMVTVLNGTRQGDKVVYGETGDVVYGQPIDGLAIEPDQRPSILNLGAMECFVQPVEKDPEVLVLGAGHVSRCIADMLLFIGCHVTVVDDRAEYLRPDFFDERVRRLCLDFNDLASQLPLNNYKGIIIVTRAHEYDSICLNQVRHLVDSTYMGVMGSHKRVFHAFEVLKESGWTQAELDKIYAPIGLSLGAETPEEIALSIVSEFLAVTRGHKAGFLSRGGQGR